MAGSSSQAMAIPNWQQIKWHHLVGLATPIALYLVWRKGRSTDWFGQPVLETDFDSFLVRASDHPTGLAPPSNKKDKKHGKKAGRSKLAASERGKVSGPFETFLKVEADNDSEEEYDPRDPLDFNSFLKTAQKSASSNVKKPDVAATANGEESSKPKGPRPDQARVLVMFGTEYGFSKEIAEKLCEKLQAADKYWPVLLNMADHPEGYDLSSEQAVFMACSTQGDGVPPTEAREFCDWLFAGKAGNLPHLHFSVCAQGDKSYQHFCRCGKQLDAALEAAGANRIAARQDINKEDYQAVDTWIGNVVDALAKLELKPVGEAGAAKSNSAKEVKSTTRKWGKSRPYPAKVVAVEGLCAVSSKEDKNTVRVELDLGDSNLTYLPGDALGIYPVNCKKYVSELLEVLQADASHQIPTPSWHYELPGDSGRPASMALADALALCYDIKTPKAELFQLIWQALPSTLRQQAEDHPTANGYTNGHANGIHEKSAVANGGDVEVVKANGHVTDGHTNGHHHANGNGTTLPENGFGGLHAKAEASEQVSKARLLLSLIGGGSTEQEAYMSQGRHVVDILKEFSFVQLTLQQVLGTLRQLQPRLYSISSAPAENTQRVQATIAEVRYTALGSDRIGVCSTYVSDRIQVGQEVSVYIHKNPDFRLPPSHLTPIIMVGPGTGLAPFRSFILDRLLQSGRLSITNGMQAQEGTVPVGEMVLFFGCRRPDQDYLYGSHLESWSQSGLITLHTAFSRAQAQKVYVQDRLREQADAIWNLLDAQGAHFYVCGDASSMAGAVEKQLLNIIADGLIASKRVEGAENAQKQAAEYLKNLSNTGRYQRDVWY